MSGGSCVFFSDSDSDSGSGSGFDIGGLFRGDLSFDDLSGIFLAFVVFLSCVSVNHVSGLLVVPTLKLGQT